MSRRGENIFKRKDGRWEARYITHYENGKAKYGYLYARTYADAKEKRVEALRRLSQPKIPREKALATVEQLARLWLSDVRLSVKESTFARYRSVVERHIVPHIGELQAMRCDGLTVNAFSQTLLEAGGAGGNGLSPKTVTDVLCVLKSIIKFARACGYGFGNTDSIRLPKRTPNPARALSPNNRIKLEGILMDSEDLTALGVLFSLFSGVRLGELCGLRWEDVDLGAMTVRVARTVERIAETDVHSPQRTKLIISEPKTKNSVREIPLPRFFGEHLRRFERREGCYILTGTETPLEPNRMYMRYKTLMNRLGMGEYTFHALRHTFATRCVEAGFDIKSLAEILGHANVTTTLGIYVHPTMEQKRSQMERLAPESR